ncbi:MAG: penicillin-binding transpeptidase domain-containing protein, partial [Myxococcota bacterium]
VGNFDFFAARGGQIPGFDRPRSPGSALKPFLYALAIDTGRILPERLVADVPRRFGTYSPKNYDGKFDGLVRFEDALARSLNVPFVDLLAELGVETFIGHLASWGVRSLQEAEGHYGLSAAIGSLAVTPLEMAGLYTMLARQGRFRPVKVQPEEVSDLAVFSPGTAFLTQRALRIRDRPDFPSRRRWSGVSPKIHWKTGTSYGHRDAWAAGSDDRFTVVVWMGNFDNSSSRHLVGAEVAGPVLFDILEALSTGRSAEAVSRPPEDLVEVQVCQFSGHRPTAACPHRRSALALRHNVPTEPCPYHLSVDVARRSGHAVRPGCRAGVDYETRSFLRVPSSVRRWLNSQRRDLPAPPDWSPDCLA